MAADNEETLIKDRARICAHAHIHTHKQKVRENRREKRPAVGPYGESQTGGQGFTERKNAAKNRDIKRKTEGRE